MGALFNGTNNYLLNSATAVKALPFTVGCWVQPMAASTNVVIWACNAGSAFNDGYGLVWTSPNYIALATASGINQALATAAGILSSWSYVVARWISTTNIRISVLNSDGTVAHAQDVTSTTTNTSLITAETMGAGNTTPNRLFTGLVAEWWLALADVQPDGGQLSEHTLRQLAFGGPFSLPSLETSLVDYRSLRNNLDSASDVGIDYFGSKLGRQVWTKSATPPILSTHPPLPGWYRAPNDQIRTGII